MDLATFSPPSLPRAARHTALSLLTLLLLLVSLAPRHALALTATDLQIIMVTDPLFVSDSNGCSGGAGPQAAYVGFKVTNTSGSLLTNLTVTLGDFDPGFGLAGGQLATQSIGALAAGASDTAYWFMFYPCHTAADVSDTLTVTVSNGVSAPYVYTNATAPSTTTTDNVTTTVQSVSTISAQAGGLFQSGTLGPGAVVGQIIPYDVTYEFGGADVGDRYNLQPSGESSFNAGCFQLVNAEIIATNVTAISAGTRDDLFYYASVQQTGSGKTVTVRYYFSYQCNGISTTTLPYASQTSGSTNVKYAESGYIAANSISFPPASQALVISKSASPATLPTGGTVTYTVLITNTSVFGSAFTRITDVLPAGVTYGGLTAATSPEIANLASSSPTTGASGTLVWQGGQPSTYPYESFHIPAGSTLRLVYTANVPNVEGTYTNSATAAVGLLTLGPVTASVGVGSAEVALDKAATATVGAGGDITYTIAATTTGNTSATVTDTLPAGVTFKSLTASAGWSCSNPAVGAGGTVSCTNATFGVASSPATFTVVVASGAALPSGTVINNTATIASPLDTTPANNSDGASTTITSPALAANKTAALVEAGTPNGVADPGDTLRYTVEVANSGNGSANGVTFADVIPANTSYVAGSTTLNGAAVADVGGAMPFSGGAAIKSPTGAAGEIKPAETATVVFDVQILNPLPAGVTQVSNQGVVRSPGLLDLPTNDPATPATGDPTITPVVATPLLSAVKSAVLVGPGAANGVADPGDTLEYTVTVANTGNTAATGATFADAIPANISYVAGSTTLNGAAIADVAGAMPFATAAPINTPGESAGQINPGESATIVFQVQIVSPLPLGVTRVQNQGVVRAASLPDLPTDDPTTPATGDTTVTPVVAAPVLAASKSASLTVDADGDGQPSPGDTLTYAVTVRNSGNTAATGVAFSDTPDSNTALVVGSVLSDLGTVSAGNAGGDTGVGVTIGTLAAGASANISFQVTITSPLATGVSQLSNQGTFSATNHPSVPTDDPSTPTVGDPTVTSVVAAPVLAASKSASLAVDADSDGVPSPGDTLSYLITIRNSGNTAATGVSFSDTPGANTALVPNSASTSLGTVTAAATSVAVDIGTLPAGAVATVSFLVTIDSPLPAGVTQLSNQGIVSSTNHPSVPTNDPSTPTAGDPTITSVVAAPVLAASKSASLAVDADGDGRPSPGDTLTYAVTVRNSGNTAATGVVFSDTPDANTAIVAGSILTSRGSVTSGNSLGATLVVVDLGTIPAGEDATISFQVTITSPLATGVSQLSNQGTFSATNHPSVPTDDPSTPTVGDPTVTSVVAAPVLAASKSASLTADADGDGRPSPGDTLTYIITLHNDGNTAATGVSFSDTPDANTTLVPNSASTSLGTVTAATTSVAVAIGEVPAGATVSVTFRVTIDSPLATGVSELSNQGTFSATNHPSVPTDDPSTPTVGDPTVTSVVAAPVLAASKSASLTADADGDGRPSPGDTLSYLITVRNSGNTAATGVSFSDTPDANTTLVPNSASTSLGTVTAATTSVAVDIGTLPAGATATISYRVTINSPLAAGVTQLLNQGVVGSTNHPSVPTDSPNTPASGDPTITPIVAAPRIQVSKTSSLATDADNNGQPSPGDTLRYLITVRNSGNQAGLAVAAQDIVDPNTTLVVGSVITSRGTVLRGNTAGDTGVAADLGALPGGEQATMSFLVRVVNPLPSGVRQVANQATVSGGNFLPALSDDPSTPAAEDPTRTAVVATPVLSAAKGSRLLADNDGDGFPSPGDDLLYTVQIANSGNTAATGVVFTDTPDANTTLIAGSVQTTAGAIVSGNAGASPVQVTIGTLPVGGQVTISFAVRIAASLPAGALRVANQGSLTSVELPALPTDDPSTLSVDDPTITPVVAAPDLTADKSARLIVDADNDGRVSPGDQLLYTITVVNRGNAEAPGVLFTDTPDANTSIVAGSVSVSQGAVVGGNNGVAPITAELGNLPGRGGSAVVSFRATISPTTTALSVVNQAQASTGALVAATNNPDTAAGGDPTVTVITRGPTAISLASFSASWVKGAPLVHWTTAVEVSSYGFHIYRGLTPSRSDAVRVTAELIPAQGGGSSYSWQDTGASSGQRYWYWLEEVELDGSVNHYGPAATQELTAVGGYRVYLPAVTR